MCSTASTIAKKNKLDINLSCIVMTDNIVEGDSGFRMNYWPFVKTITVSMPDTYWTEMRTIFNMKTWNHKSTSFLLKRKENYFTYHPMETIDDD